MRNSSRGLVDPFIVMDMMEAARQAEAAGRRVIHMEVGQPGTGAPREALARLRREMEAGALGYTVALGLPELRAVNAPDQPASRKPSASSGGSLAAPSFSFGSSRPLRF